MRKDGVPVNGQMMCIGLSCYFICNPGFILEGEYKATCVSAFLDFKDLPECNKGTLFLMKLHLHGSKVYFKTIASLLHA